MSQQYIGSASYLAALSNTAPSALAAVYAVRSAMTALGAYVGAKLQRPVAWVYLHKLDDHRSCAHGAMRGRHGRQPFFRSHLISFRADQSRHARYAARATIKATRNTGTTIGGTNQLTNLWRSGRPGVPLSFLHLAIAADETALTSEMFAMNLYGYENEESY